MSLFKKYKASISSFAVIISAVLASPSGHAGLVDATDFAGLTVGSSASFDRVGNDGIDDMTITYNSGNFTAAQFFTTPTANNPAEIASQTVSWFLPAGGGTSGIVTIDFAIPLVAGDGLFFVDFDSLESVAISAFFGGNALSTDAWTLSQFEGSGGTPSSATWNSSTGTLSTGSGALANPVDILTVDATIDRLVYNISQPASTMAFNWSAKDSVTVPPTVDVPEPVGTTLLTMGLVGMGIARRRSRSAAAVKSDQSSY